MHLPLHRTPLAQQAPPHSIPQPAPPLGVPEPQGQHSPLHQVVRQGQVQQQEHPQQGQVQHSQPPAGDRRSHQAWRLPQPTPDHGPAARKEQKPPENPRIPGQQPRAHPTLPFPPLLTEPHSAQPPPDDLESPHPLLVEPYSQPPAKPPPAESTPPRSWPSRMAHPPPDLTPF